MASQWREVSAKAAVLVFVGLAIRFLMRNRRPDAADSSTDHEEKDGDTVSDATEMVHGTEELSSSLQRQALADPGHEFEVFLSFRGTDIPQTFTNCLYHSLQDVGVRTFRDNEELHVGKEIGPDLMRAITQSKISMPIFTKGYASSKWCLREVAQMVKCMKDTDGKHMIMPIFLDVTPDVVQHQTEAYAEWFAQHERRHSSETVNEWRDALAEVTRLKGLELEKAASGNQGEFIKLVVVSILRELKKACLNENEIQVGMDSSAKEVMHLLEANTEDSSIVGMWGIGGIGKTTLAKHVYNQILDNFECCSFLSDIREASKNQRGLPLLQSKLISDILGCGKYDFASIEEGINVLKNRLRSKKSLILLDDVDHIDQLKALAGDLCWFGSGSRILVTTRDKEVLLRFQDCSIYEVKSLDKDQALELFFKHAYRNQFPPTEFVDLSEEIVGMTGGLPLALEVIGSFLFVHRERKGIWQDTVKQLKRKPHDDVQGKLRISYDALTHEHKEIFLDIACFFIGAHYGSLIPMWDDCEFSPTVGIEVLQLKSLIKVTNGGRLQMHDQLRDLGRHIVEQENYKEPGCRSRLWRKEEVMDVLLSKQGKSKVEAAFNIRSEEEVVFHGDCFKNLSHLRILELSYGAVLAGDFQHLLFNLRLLRWKTPELSQAENLQLNNLVFLDMSNSSVGDDWNGWSSIKMGRLKVLDLSWCHKLGRTPSFSAFPNLERLILEHCDNLVRIDPTVKLLKNLNYLNLSKCSKLENLPNEMAQLEGLIELYANGTGVKEVSIESQSSIKMGKLKVLDLSDCKQLRAISSLALFPNLERLMLKGCRNLISVHESIGLLKNLQYLSPVFCSKLHNLPDQFAHLYALVELNISKSGIKTIPVSPRMKKLETLDASSCRHLERLPDDISCLTHLHSLTLYGCCDLQNLPKLPPSLTDLRVGGPSVGTLQNLKDLINLKELQLHGDRLEPLQNLNEQAMAKFSQLEKLILKNVNFCSLPEEIASSPQIKVIEIDWSDGLATLPPLSPNLCLLTVTNCPLFQRLPNLSNLKKLSELRISECPMLRKIEGLSDLTSLQVLWISGCHSTVIDGVDRVSSLHELTIERFDIEALPDLANLQMLRRLVLNGNWKLADIQGISTLSGLQFMQFDTCTSLEQIHEIANLESLVELRVMRCSAIEHLPLSKLQRLKCLFLLKCDKLCVLEGVDELNSLKVLLLRSCKAIEVLPHLQEGVQLIIEDCGKLEHALTDDREPE